MYLEIEDRHLSLLGRISILSLELSFRSYAKTVIHGCKLFLPINLIDIIKCKRRILIILFGNSKFFIPGDGLTQCQLRDLDCSIRPLKSIKSTHETVYVDIIRI